MNRQIANIAVNQEGRPMPELPELEILKAELKDKVVGKMLTSITVKRGAGEEPTKESMKRELRNVERYGKMLVLEFSGEVCIVVHLLLVGQILLLKEEPPEEKGPTMVLEFDDGDKLQFKQISLKNIHTIKKEELLDFSPIKKLGVDPFSEEFTAETLADILHKRDRQIKAILTDQGIIAGIGNTYANEILFESRIHPQRKSSSLSEEEIKVLHDNIDKVLRKAIEMGGSSEMAFVHLDGSKGRFHEQLKVHGREGEPCLVCGTSVERINIGGRGTYFCPSCQKLR